MKSFSQLPSVAKLKKFAKTPPVLSKVLTPERISAMVLKGKCFQLFYATEKVDAPILKALEELAQETQAVQKMKAMQGGAILNYIEGFASEKRAVLHTAMRDFFDHKRTEKEAQEAAHLAHNELEKLKKFLQRHEGNYTDLIQIGIGGSELGPKAIYIALERYARLKVHFLSNVDPDDAAAIFKKVNLATTLIISVSKSGSTLETRTNEEWVRERLRQAGLVPKDRIVAVTGKGSPMDDPSLYLESFYMWDYVGGRYSVTSMVGLVMLGLALGFPHIMEFLKGAHTVDLEALEEDPLKNPPLFSALLSVWNRNFLNCPTAAILPYSQALNRFTAHLQQCEMESNGKRIDKEGQVVDFSTGPIIWGEPGTNGQHSFYQLIHQGTDQIPLEFIGFKKSQFQEDYTYLETTSQDKLLSNLFAQMIALAQGKKSDNPNTVFPGNRSSRLVFCSVCDPYHLGALLSYFEHRVAFQGFIWNINSFDQEGVQLGKQLAKEVLEVIVKKRKKHLEPQLCPLGQAYLSAIDIN